MASIHAVLFLLGCAMPLLGQQTISVESLRFDPKAVDRSVEPCTDFYQYACSKWMTNHPIPSDRSAWDPYYELEEKNAAIVRGILEGQERGEGGDYPKVTTYYAACMDQATIDAKGLQALDDDLGHITRMRSPGDSVDALALVQTLGAAALFSFYPNQDLKAAERVLATLDYGLLGMTDRDYYLKDDEESKKLRDGYRQHVRRMLEASGLSHDASLAGADSVLRLETLMAQAMPSREQLRDHSTQYHKLTVAQLKDLIPSWPWSQYFVALGAHSVDNVNVASPEYLQKMARAWLDLSSEERKAYLRWHLLHALVAALPQRFVEEDFHFYGTVLQGVKEMPALWKRCGRLTNDALGEAVGKIFVARHFPGDERERALAEIRAIQAALRDDISKLDWMSDATRQEALRKLDVFRIKVGYPDRWRDYTGLEVRNGDAMGNVIRARRFDFARQMQKFGKPVDRDEWFSLPQDVDGYQTAALVEIVFTAGLLQPPFFDPSMDNAVNFGAIGRAMGHEFIHSFDDHGRKFDEHGSLRDWWTPGDSVRFEERAKCFVDEYSQIVVVDDKTLNGRLTLGENLADNGGLRLAYAALQNDLAVKARPMIDGLTPEQRLFLAFAETQCGNITDETARNRLLTDPHAPGRWRVNGTVRNMPEFQKAFACKATDPMVSPHPCRLW
jgi:endothelin-converting enzyme/putative endopeptidase